MICTLHKLCLFLIVSSWGKRRESAHNQISSVWAFQTSPRCEILVYGCQNCGRYLVCISENCLLRTDSPAKLQITIMLSRLDYCNNVLHGLRKFAIHELQLVLNAAARLVVKDIKHFKTMTSWISVFKQLHSVNRTTVSLPKCTSCNSCANIACTDRSMRHNHGREALNYRRSYCTVHTHVLPCCHPK